MPRSSGGTIRTSTSSSPARPKARRAPCPPSVRDVDAIVNYSPTADLAEKPDVFPECRIVVRAGVGFDNLDLKGWGARGVPVCNAPDYGTTEVADHAHRADAGASPRHRDLRRRGEARRRSRAGTIAPRRSWRGSRAPPSASSGSAGSASPPPAAPPPSTCASSSTIPICRTAPTSRSATSACIRSAS